MLLGLYYMFIMYCMARGIRHHSYHFDDEARRKRCINAEDYLPLGMSRLLQQITAEEDNAAVCFTVFIIPISYMIVSTVIVVVAKEVINAWVVLDNPDEPNHHGITFMQVLTVYWICEAFILVLMTFISCARHLHRKNKLVREANEYIDKTFVDVTPEQREEHLQQLLYDPEEAKKMMAPTATQQGEVPAKDGTAHQRTVLEEHASFHISEDKRMKMVNLLLGPNQKKTSSSPSANTEQRKGKGRGKHAAPAPAREAPPVPKERDADK